MKIIKGNFILSIEEIKPECSRAFVIYRNLSVMGIWEIPKNVNYVKHDRWVLLFLFKKIKKCKYSTLHLEYGS